MGCEAPPLPRSLWPIAQAGGMSPPFFFLSLVSITMIWTITTVGLPSYCWTYFVVPCVSVYCLCDPQKLSEGVVRDFTKSFRGASISIAVLSSLYMGYLPWKMIILVCCGFCLSLAFSSEKMMFTGDVCGEYAKNAWWRVAGRLLIPNQFNRMGWKGEWAHCSPYSRKLQHKDINFYYKLADSVSLEAEIPEPFHLEFNIEDCKVSCKYYAAGAGGRSSENLIISRPAVAEIRQELAASVCSDEAGTSSSQGAASDGCSLPHTGVVEVPVQHQAQVHKLEVTLSLLEGGEELESFTFFQNKGDRVVEIKQALEVLKDHGNVIFSSLHRNIGSRNSQAHARCYEFLEIFELILNGGLNLRKVKLSTRHACSIGGKTLLHILNTGVLVWMNYYQLSGAPKASFITMLTLLPLFHLSFVLLDVLSGVQTAKRCLYALIRCVRPNQVDNWYKIFQVKWPSLTFCNQSYGRPYSSQDCTEICCFEDMSVLVRESKQVYFDFLDLAGHGKQDYVLGNVKLVVDVKHGMDESAIEVIFEWVSNGEMFDRKFFRVVNSGKVSNLVRVLHWLQANKCQGVCKKWEKNVMHSYTYVELVEKLLDKACDKQPWLVQFKKGRFIYVE